MMIALARFHFLPNRMPPLKVRLKMSRRRTVRNQEMETPSSKASSIVTNQSPSQNPYDQTVSAKIRSQGMPLPKLSYPGPMDVICQRGKGASNHPGNKRYLQIIESSMEKYSTLHSRIQKSLLVAQIVHSIQRASPNGGFVKPDGVGGWIRVSDEVAQGKVGQSLRDLLHDRYKSSTAAKKRRRQEVNEQLGQDLDEIIQSNKEISEKLSNVSKELRKMGPEAPDESVSSLFDKANSELLDVLKRNAAEKDVVAENRESGPTTLAPSSSSGCEISPNKRRKTK